MTTDPEPVIAITSGDPCGIGPEVILKALRSPRQIHSARLVVIGDLPVFERTARRLRQRVPGWHVVSRNAPWPAALEPLTFFDCAHPGSFAPGRRSPAAGKASLAYLHRAIQLAKARRIEAVVTAPVTKWAIEQAHHGFIGQTEYLADAFGRRDVVMMFVSDGLRVVLLTRHQPLRRVPQAVSPRLLRMTLQMTAAALRRDFHIRRPRLAVCGLNPHAGEGGLFGHEERRVLLPVLQDLRRRIRCDGPFAADGFFAQRASWSYDAVVCWYHDQGLIPFKMAARDRGCQLSLGLPIIRTSPDHGSALDIAGGGIANPGSMQYALDLAVRLAQRNR